jgi:hypothetical protein
VRLSNSGNFTDCITSTDKPKPKFVCAAGSRIVIANIGSASSQSPLGLDPDPRLVWFSEEDDVRSFSENNRSGYFPIYDDTEPITGMWGGQDFIYIFKPNKCYLVDYKSSFEPSYRPISNIGTVHPQSGCWADGVLYFWGNNGPSRIIYDNVEEFGIGVFSRSLSDADFLSDDINNIGGFRHPENQYDHRPDPDNNPGNICAMFDKSSNTVIWSYSSSSGSVNNLDRFFLYNIPTGKSSVYFFGDGRSQANTNEETLYARRGTMIYYPTGSEWPLPNLMFAGPGVTASGTLYRFSKTIDIYDITESPLITSGLFEFSANSKTRVTGVRLNRTHRSSSDLLKYTVSVITRDKIYETMDTVSLDQDSEDPISGIVEFASTFSGTFHMIKFELNVSSGNLPSDIISELSSFTVFYEIDGEK